MLVWLTLAVTLLLPQSESALVKQPATNAITGFVYCSEPNQTSVPVFLDACNKLRIGSLACGQKLQIIEREAGHLKVVAPDGLERYMTQESVSQATDNFVGFTDREVRPSTGTACKTIKTLKREHPTAIYSPAPDYSEKARKKGLQGTVITFFSSRSSIDFRLDMLWHR